ncbi:hypothetical protein [Virgibacillus oceani]|uniref:DUF4352 domain-containing protein n=1 Tax=Virgibacillus oceani TaxID=1479511 RepID=A0A917M5N0_9BACI|nr:hypothetical protein [Virgibacillus oceani]GGG78818.1 hypothetical protein GCM10011398_25150 [Virgibacillus oceani]
MSKLKFMVTWILFLLLMGTAIGAHASSDFNELPTKQTSKQWAVQVGEAKQGKDLAKPQKGKFETYSLTVKNIGKDVESVDFYMFRNEPDSTTMYSLFSCPDGKDCNEVSESIDKGMSFKFDNFIFAEKATELEVVILWTENGRTLKETFTFTE